MMKTRLAVWSGPRNISTSLMRSFSNRGDCKVMDEPFYGAYLFKTRKYHPLRDEIIKNMSTNYNEIAKRCSESNFLEKILYQKQMAHHILSEIDLKFFRLDFRFRTLESGSRGDFLRRFRICGQKLRIQASRGRNSRKTTSIWC